MKCLFALVFAAPVFAQVSLPGGAIPIPNPIPAVFQITYTTGLVGFTTNQTARLNVLNMNPAPSATTSTTSSSTSTSTGTTQPANCTVALQFYDNKGTQISQTTVPNFAPGGSTSFDLPRASVTSETSARAEIRGVVAINPESSSTTSSTSSSTAEGNCSVFTTLEVFDATSGSTIFLTSDTRQIGLQILQGMFSVIQ